jgi:plastocyanin
VDAAVESSPSPRWPSRPIEAPNPYHLRAPVKPARLVEVRNDGNKNHNFTIDSLNVSTGPVHHGDVKTVRFTAPKGTTAFSCTWHKGMVGRIVAA